MMFQACCMSCGQKHGRGIEVGVFSTNKTSEGCQGRNKSSLGTQL